MDYQSQRKLHRTLLTEFAKPQGAILILECAVAAWLVWQHRARRLPSDVFWLLLLTGSIALGLQVYAVLGGEFLYDVYSLAFVPATFFCIACRVARECAASAASRLVSATPAAVLSGSG